MTIVIPIPSSTVAAIASPIASPALASEDGIVVGFGAGTTQASPDFLKAEAKVRSELLSRGMEITKPRQRRTGAYRSGRDRPAEIDDQIGGKAVPDNVLTPLVRDPTSV